MRPSPEEIERRTAIVRGTVGELMPPAIHDMLAASFWLGEQLHTRGIPVADAEVIGRAFGGRSLDENPWDVAEVMLAEYMEA